MYQSMSIPEFEQKMKKENVDLIDVREADEFAAGHIPGATHVPLSGFPEAAEALDKNKHYHVICHSGGRSTMACEQLSQAGYDVTNIMGGMSAWRGETE
ncbi:rhodanese-like domain-containing protein [Pisciglobus halotolerans]|uniref:Rhodanese-related sulfurtransferase n=1 Tax=Pisciglobus halotolerans TaxID=745365 RepID=A0A1I3D094_9LACT|nr:rhodanese-like domain-containing protein [Pisciglobus halotolerans]SFH80135.1 Rhodanese-related sulfurtransferase [Pisciglobus halotolerans]